MVHTEETGTFLMGPDFHSLLVMAMVMRVVLPKELIFIVVIRINMVYIVVTYQHLRFMMMMIAVYETQCMLDSIIPVEVRCFGNTIENNFPAITGDVRTGNVSVDSSTPFFTLTCNSTGGPATTVTWTRDSTTLTEGNMTSVLVDPVTALYTHNLTMTERLGGNYICTVANNKPSSDSSTLLLKSKFIVCHIVATLY